MRRQGGVEWEFNADWKLFFLELFFTWNHPIPLSVKEINGYNAFQCCELEHIQFPPNVSFGEEAFNNCEELATSIFPQSVGDIKGGASLGCLDYLGWPTIVSSPSKQKSICNTLSPHLLRVRLSETTPTWNCNFT